MTRLQASITVSLSLVSLHNDHIGSRRCPSCSDPMHLHQPESGSPNRMLWTCASCETWFLMDIDPDKNEAILVRLPEHGYFRAAIG
jgi:hypothetical protein